MAEMNQPDLSIIIVTWNSEEEIIECLHSIYLTKYSELAGKVETIGVDNDSQDRTVSAVNNFKKVNNFDIKIKVNDKNLGFTRAASMGAIMATGKKVMLLNPDTEVFEDALIKLMKYLDENKDVGIAAPQLVFKNQSIQHSCRTLPTYKDMFCEMTLLSKIFPKSKFFSRWKMNYFDHNETCEVEQPMGAALMMKMETMKEIDYLDNRYDMFFNDVDLCKKVKLKGYKIIFYVDAKIIHRQGVSVYKNRAYMIKLWNSDCLKYFKKFHYNFILYTFLIIGLKVSGFIRRFIDK